MKTTGAILLVSCYELGHQPLNLASPLAVLRQAGYRPLAVDTSVEPLSNELVAQARFVGISVPMHTAMRLGVEVARRVRARNPQAHICFYGLYATLNADYLLQHCADSVISGEYEEPLLALVQALERGDQATVVRIGGGNGARQPHIAKIPFTVPERATLPPLERYARFRYNGTTALAGYTETSRGCLHTCRHCPITPIYKGRFFVIPREIVLQDIRQQVALGARHITFGDPDFFNGPGHSMAVVRQMHREFPDLTFDVTVKIEHILEFRHYFPELKELGCAFVVSAVESLNDRVLEKLKKGHTRADVVEALNILGEADIPLRASFVAFTPWTTLDDYLEMLNFVETHGLIQHVDPVQYSIRLLIPPGSAILELPDVDAWLGPLDAASYTYRWEHPDPRMDELHQRVSELVEEATRTNADVVTTFHAVKTLAAEVAGLPLPESQPCPTAPAAPGLTEAWFC
jgi:radical SAM superfamily enzyme YgiQ (UPF0313 family)